MLEMPLSVSILGAIIMAKMVASFNIGIPYNAKRIHVPGTKFYVIMRLISLGSLMAVNFVQGFYLPLHLVKPLF